MSARAAQGSKNAPGGGASGSGASGGGAPARLGLGDAARLMRETLSVTQFPGEEQKKAALRRILHQALAGLEEVEAREFIDALRTRFPDRLFEAGARAHEAEGRLAKLEREVAQLRASREELRRRLDLAEGMINRLHRAVTQPGTLGSVPPGSPAPPAVDPVGVQPLFDAIALVITLAMEQEPLAIQLHASIAPPAGGGRPQGTLADLLKTVAALGPGQAAAAKESLAEVRRRLNLMKRQAAAMMESSDQTWKSGTQRIVESLDPREAEKEISRKIPGLRDAAVLKEVRQRFEAFQGDLDKNIDHYYRETFKTIYARKMEERS